MSAKDVFHNAVRAALEKDDWTITHDPLRIKMERINYPELVQEILKGHSGNDLENETEVQLIFDTKHNHFMVLHLGWKEEGMRRVYGCIIHVDIKDGKIWIQRDGTEIGIANELLDKGVPKQDIVLGFHAPYKRKFTDFAAS